MSGISHIAEVVTGAVQQIAANNGKDLGHPHGLAKYGAGAVTAAPVVAAKGAALATMAAPLLPLVAVGAAAYGLFKLFEE